jgi:hypothetical protein
LATEVFLNLIKDFAAAVWPEWKNRQNHDINFSLENKLQS